MAHNRVNWCHVGAGFLGKLYALRTKGRTGEPRGASQSTNFRGPAACVFIETRLSDR